VSSSKEHMWKKGPGVAEEQGQNVLDALPSDAYKWKQGEYEAPTNVLDSLPEDRQKWHKYTPEKSPLDQLSDAHYSWKGPGAQAPNPMDELNTKPHVWRGPGPPAVNPMDQLDDKPHQVCAPRRAPLLPVRRAGLLLLLSAAPAS
jgi:hypothetical protein